MTADATVPLDHVCRYDELTDVLRRLAADHPELLSLESIGRSHEGRDIWLVTATDAATGAHDTKPAMWVDGNIHATELTASVAALALLGHLVDGHGTDPRVTEALATRTFYVVPRVNPDGAELALAEDPRFLRSSTRHWPWTDRWEQPGLHRRDVDGDGRILSMRIPDPTGAWTTHADDARLMVPVPPDGWTDGRPRYRMLTEGEIVDHDGYTVPTPRADQGLDLNRNFPAGWGTKVTGAGDFPGSEPEVAALMRAMTARPNICGANAYHTYGGVLLRPSSSRPDTKLSPDDRWVYGQLGATGTELTGFEVHSTFEDFTWDTTDVMSGAGDDWAYDHLGVFSWTTEFWDPIAAATGERAPLDLWFVSLEPATELAVLRWFDAEHPGGYVDWYPFDHPQLGPVELGGWDSIRTWSNPPDARLATEVAGHPEFAVFQAMSSPRLEIERVEAIPLGDDRWRIVAGIANTGWLPTTVTALAAAENLVRPVLAELEPADGVELVAPSTNRQLLGQLQGRSRARFTARHDGTPNRVRAEWLVSGPAGAEVAVVAAHQRAGRSRRTVVLGG